VKAFGVQLASGSILISIDRTIHARIQNQVVEGYTKTQQAEQTSSPNQIKTKIYPTSIKHIQCTQVTN
jgi:hypothetical protein